MRKRIISIILSIVMMLTLMPGFALNAIAEDLSGQSSKECKHKQTSIVNSVEATCTEKGYSGDEVCADCGQLVKSGSELEAKGHNFTTWKEEKAPTCTAKGVEKRSCKRCGTTETRPVDAKGHNFGSWKEVTAPSCTRGGMEIRNCKRCDFAETRIVPATGHNFTSWKEVKAATCTDDGLETRSCKTCDEVETRTIAAPGHKYKTKVTKPTCTTRGYTTYTCSECGYSYKGDYVAANGHNYKTKVVAPKASRQGYTKYKCTECNYSYKGNYTIAAPTVTIGTFSSSGRIRLTWDRITGAEKYYVYRSTDGRSYEFHASTTKLGYTDTKAEVGKRYYYKVKAVKANGTTSKYSASHYMTCKLARPSVSITTYKGDPKLSWDKVPGATRYEVYRATSLSGSYTKMLSTTKRSYTNTSARAGTTYYYKVKAVCSNASASSAYSTAVSIKAK